MNPEDIIRMALESGIYRFKVKNLKRFATLVATYERQECAKECDIQSAWGNDDKRFGARLCANAIRARGNK